MSMTRELDLIHIIEGELCLPAGEVSLNSRIVEDLNADSLEMISILLRIEREMGVRIGLKDSKAINKVSDITGFLNS